MLLPYGRAGFPLPFEIHVYRGSSFNPAQDWVVKSFEGVVDYRPTRREAIVLAVEEAQTFLFAQRIYVLSEDECVIIVRNGERK